LAIVNDNRVQQYRQIVLHPFTKVQDGNGLCDEYQCDPSKMVASSSKDRRHAGAKLAAAKIGDLRTTVSELLGRGGV
jgi:hypothetical protein